MERHRSAVDSLPFSDTVADLGKQIPLGHRLVGFVVVLNIRIDLVQDAASRRFSQDRGVGLPGREFRYVVVAHGFAPSANHFGTRGERGGSSIAEGPQDWVSQVSQMRPRKARP